MSQFRRLMLSALFSLIITSLAACAGAQATPTSSQAALDGTEWKLVSLNGQPLVAGTHITLAFADGHISGFSGCNW